MGVVLGAFRAVNKAVKAYVEGYVAQQVPYVRGAGHDSVVLVATPNPEDPSVDRTNTVTGDYSAVIGRVQKHYFRTRICSCWWYR